MDSKTIGKSTQSVWGGEGFDGKYIATPVVRSVAFAYDDVDRWEAVAVGEQKGHIYSRNTNPTVAVLEEKIRLLEGGEAATSFATGMGAISNTLFTLLKPGSRVVSIKDTYGGTSKLFLDFLPIRGVKVALYDATDLDGLEACILQGCDVVYLESPTNPTLKVVDLSRLSIAARKVGALVVVDNTFATPINQNPLALGADLVLHSATKFLCGHSDAMGGLLTGRADLVKQVFEYREITGASLQADAAYLIERGMKTLALRIERQNSNAQKIAMYLQNHPKVADVFYPGLPTHPGHELAKQQMSGFGGMLSFSLDGTFEKVKKLLSKLTYAHMAASLGSVGTLVGPPRTTSHVELTDAQRAALGIPEALIRFSVGIENVEDLIADVDEALAKI